MLKKKCRRNKFKSRNSLSLIQRLWFKNDTAKALGLAGLVLGIFIFSSLNEIAGSQEDKKEFLRIHAIKKVGSEKYFVTSPTAIKVGDGIRFEVQVARKGQLTVSVDNSQKTKVLVRADTNNSGIFDIPDKKFLFLKQPGNYTFNFRLKTKTTDENKIFGLIVLGQHGLGHDTKQLAANMGRGLGYEWVDQQDVKQKPRSRGLGFYNTPTQTPGFKDSKTPTQTPRFQNAIAPTTKKRRQIKFPNFYDPCCTHFSRAYLSVLDDDTEQNAGMFPSSVSLNSTRSTGAKVFRMAADSVVLVRSLRGRGTGTIISGGQILTNWHVIKDSRSVFVYFKPPNFGDLKTAERHRASVIKFDARRDLALLQLQYVPQNISVLKFGKLKDIEIGMNVHAIGHPEGNNWSYTMGVVSQIRPNYPWSDKKYKFRADVIQTQTPINPGNSGGPLLTDNVKLIGINAFGRPESDGLNFSIALPTLLKFIRAKHAHILPEKKNEKKKINRLMSFFALIGEPYDRNRNGRVEEVRIDMNRNEKLDTIVIDKDEDGYADLMLLDRNENKILERVIHWKKIGGRVYGHHLYDTNEDGKWDKQGWDYDLDGNPDKVERIPS